MGRRTSIKDVARQAGVSYQTVSRVINNKSEVSSETRTRVLAAIEALNYRPSLAAQVFARERTMIIGVVIPWSVEFLSDNHHLLQMVMGVDLEASLRDYSVLLSTSHAKDDNESSYRRLLRRHIVDGVIVEGGMGQSGAAILMEKGYRVIMAGRNSLGLPFVDSDLDGGKYNATQHLLALGHQRIALISGPAEGYQTRNPLQGCFDALQHAGLSIEQDLIAYSDFTVEAGYQTVQRLMAHPNPPTAIVAANDAVAMGVIRWLQENGRQVPQDVSVIGFDDIPSAQYFNPPLTTIHQFSSEEGRRAASMLFDVIEGHELHSAEIVVPTQLVVRGSTAMPARRL